MLFAASAGSHALVPGYLGRVVLREDLVDPSAVLAAHPFPKEPAEDPSRVVRPPGFPRLRKDRGLASQFQGVIGIEEGGLQPALRQAI